MSEKPSESLVPAENRRSNPNRNSTVELPKGHYGAKCFVTCRGFLLCIVTEESKSNYFRVSCKKRTFSCKKCTHHSIINMKSISLVMFSCSFCKFLFAP